MNEYIIIVHGFKHTHYEHLNVKSKLGIDLKHFSIPRRSGLQVIRFELFTNSMYPTTAALIAQRL